MKHIYIYIYIYSEGACIVMVSDVGNENGDSNTLGKDKHQIILSLQLWRNSRVV